MSCNFYGQAVERRSDTARQLRLQLSMTGAVRQVREPRLTSADSLRRADGFRYAQVGRMLSPEERIENEHVDSSKLVYCLVRQLLGVGDVAQIANPVTVDGDGPVRDGDRHHVHIANAKAFPGGN